MVNLDITVEGDIKKFSGINNDQKVGGSIHMTQPQLIDQVLEDLKMPENMKLKSTPASSSKLLSRHTDSPYFYR